VVTSSTQALTVSGTPSSGQILTAASSTAATWQTSAYVSLTDLRSYILQPSGDTSGAADTATLTALLLANTRIRVVLGGIGGKYYFNPGIVVGAQQGVLGLGSGLTEIFAVGGTSGQATLTFRNPSFPAGSSGAASPRLAWTNLSIPSGGFRLDGTSATSGVHGIEAGDIFQLDLTNVTIVSFTGGVGLRINNTIGWTERAHVQADITNCLVGVRWEVNGGTTSFSYSRYDLTVAQNANQDGYVWASAATMVGTRLNLGGNFTAGATNTGYGLRFGSDASAVGLSRCQANIRLEADGSSGTGHTTMDVGASAFISLDGSVVFTNGGIAWVGGTGNFGSAHTNQFFVTGFFSDPAWSATRRTAFKKVLNLTPGVSGVYGAAVSVTPPSPATGLVPLAATSFTSNISGETVTLRAAITYADGTTATMNWTGVAASGTVDLNSASNGFSWLSLFADNNVITSIAFSCTTSAATTTATDQLTVVGIYLY
jgi:hypothetical protein